MNEYKVTILGAGLAGCEAALWLAGKGVQVELYEQKPVHFSPAHKSEGFAELICSNSLKAERLDSASGLLKEEMRRMGSRLLTAAEETRVAAGGALAVDRDAFSAAVTRTVEQCENITVHREQVETIDESAPILVATGPLTDGALADEIGRLTGDERLHFYDAVAPIVTAESLDYGKVFAASRYDRGEADYLNCPFNKAEYEAFHAALAGAERAPLHDFDTGAEQSAKPDPDAHGLEKVAVDGIPRVGVVDQTVLNTSGDYAVGMLLALLITLVIQGTPAKEQDTHGERQHKAEHVEHKGGVKEHGPANTAKRHGPDRQRSRPRGTADYHAAANDFKSIDQQKANEQNCQDANDIVNANE